MERVVRQELADGRVREYITTEHGFFTKTITRYVIVMPDGENVYLENLTAWCDRQRINPVQLYNKANSEWGRYRGMSVYKVREKPEQLLPHKPLNFSEHKIKVYGHRRLTVQAKGSIKIS